MAGTARLFLWLLHGLQTLAPREPYLRMGAGSALLMILFSVEGTGRFQGLGLGTIESAFQEPSAWSWPLWKLGLTALSLAIGFKGGEFVPLVFIGSTLGSALAPLLGLPVAALGECLEQLRDCPG
jgi:H+/Cl- antiporter ClcA